MNEDKLPMRIGVGVIVFDKWQMPQGGVDLGENYLAAMKRELFEETSIKNIKVLNEIEGTFEYELPMNLVGVIWKGKYRGQKQKWFITKFTGDEKEINLNTKKPEFIEWRWLSVDKLHEVIVDFKRELYKKLQIEIKKFME